MTGSKIVVLLEISMTKMGSIKEKRKSNRIGETAMLAICRTTRSLKAFLADWAGCHGQGEGKKSRKNAENSHRD